jgi:two-component system cell cycle response regulator CpdR
MSRLDTILIADDNLDLRDMIVATLAEAGYAILAAADGYEAVRVLADNWVDLLIADIKMPGMDGFELARQATVIRQNIRVIYLSGYSPDSVQSDGPTYGPVLQKPMRMADLLDEVKRQLA